MQRLGEYTAAVQREQEEQLRRFLQADVLCDKCDTPMEYRSAKEVPLRSAFFGGRGKVRCPNCGAKGIKEPIRFSDCKALGDMIVKEED